MPLDRERLIKIMGLTTSSSDGEALSALRKANEIIAGEKLTWAEVLAQQGSVINISLARTPPQSAYKGGDEWAPPHLHDKVTIDLMFRAIFAQPRGANEEFWQWVDSVHQWYLDHHSLTSAQYEAIRKCYGRALRAGARG